MDWNKLQDLVSSGSNLASNLRHLLENLKLPKKTEDVQPSPAPQSDEEPENGESEMETNQTENGESEVGEHEVTDNHSDDENQN